MPDMPGNSHLKPQIVAPFLGYLQNGAAWNGTDCFMTYFKVGEPTAIPKLEKAMVEVAFEGNASLRETPLSFTLNPLKDLHFMGLSSSGTIAGGKDVCVRDCIVGFGCFADCVCEFCEFVCRYFVYAGKDCGGEEDFG